MTRAWIAGNGKSLNQTDLNLLKGETSFAVNNIHLIYPKTDWRPTHYVRAEGYKIPNDWEESIRVHKELGCEMWTNECFGREFNAIHTCQHNLKHFNSPECPHMLHLPVLCGFGSSVNVAVQIAMLKGYSPLYLIGCDLGYQNGKPNHFDENYENGFEQDTRYANMDTLEAHVIASRSGYEVYNATVGGNLEVYPRVDFEGLFK